MTTVSTLSICLAVLFAFLLGRSAVISTRRDNHNKKLKAEVKKLNHRLDRIADSSKYDRYYEIEEDANAYNVNMKVYVRVSSYAGEHIDTCCYCLIKQFPFDDDKGFAKSEAEELLDKLNEK